MAIYVPANVKKYDQLIADGEYRKAYRLPFVRKNIMVPYSKDIVRASAEAAAKEMPTPGGPPHASILYLKIKRNTAYTLLDIDRDGWAGVSYSISRVHPVVEKTLLQFKNIKHVVWDEAPGEKRR